MNTQMQGKAEADVAKADMGKVERPQEQMKATRCLIWPFLSERVRNTACIEEAITERGKMPHF